MIIVTGTKRSGTSLWMQILVSAGIPAFGEKFPRKWGETALREANPLGFWESKLRRGVYWETNPDPDSGVYMPAEEVEKFCCKVFALGVVRTERVYLTRVLSTMQRLSVYEVSVRRLHDLERKAIAESGKPGGVAPEPMAPWLEWWLENYALLRDASIRRYPFRAYSYDAVIRDPPKTVLDAMSWLGWHTDSGSLAEAIAQVKPELRETCEEKSSAPPEIATVCDELYDIIDRRGALSETLLAKLTETNKTVKPLIMEAQKAFYLRMMERGGARSVDTSSAA